MRTKIYIDKNTNEVNVAGELFYLSESEILLLELLYVNKGVLIDKEQIHKACWPGRLVSPASIPVAIKHIRDIFKKISGDKQIIITHKGVGYSFATDSMIDLVLDSEISNTCLELPHSSIFDKRSLCFFLLPCLTLILFFWIGMTIIANENSENIITVTHGKKQISLNLLDSNNTITSSNDNFPIMFKDVNGSVIQCNIEECIEK